MRKLSLHVPSTNYITSAIRKFMLDILSTGSFQNIGLLIWAQQGSEHVKPNRVKIKRAQLKINLHSLIVHWMLVRNGKRTVTIQCILTELLQCKLHAKCLCLLMSALFWNFGLQWLCQEASDHHGSLTIFRSAFNALSVCVSWFLIERIQFYLIWTLWFHTVRTLLASD